LPYLKLCACENGLKKSWNAHVSLLLNSEKIDFIS
jgi:hypothetical protein